MRRYSQRNQLVTLNDINITPLLDLAFVLLIIFVIATPMLEHGIKVDLPGGGQPETQPLQREDIQLVEVDSDGAYFFQGRPTGLDEIEQKLVAESIANTNMLVYIRGAGDAPTNMWPLCCTVANATRSPESHCAPTPTNNAPWIPRRKSA